MNNSLREIKNSNNLQHYKDYYNNIKDSRVSWRKKSSYKTLIKRRLNKFIRKSLKYLIKNEHLLYS